ncbi:MarR family winged helix-turn-helix transcriptional regulator [Nocardioides maradonensis]
MAKTVHGVDHGDKPLVGALLRRPFVTTRAHVVEELRAAGFEDLQPAHLAVFQHPGPDGRSPGDLARGAHATKQAMNNLLAQLERAGYLTREVNPDNRRERVVALTPRGHDAITVIRRAIAGLEAGWRDELGARDYDRLRALLERLNGLVAEETTSPLPPS